MRRFPDTVGSASHRAFASLGEGDVCRLQLPNQIDSLYVAESLIEAICRQSRIDDLVANGITLAVSEALCNIIRYGYPEEHSATGEICMTCRVEAGVLTVTLVDDGIPVPDDVTARYRDDVAAMPSVEVDIDDLPESSWGVGLMLNASSEIRHRRENEFNCLEIDFSV